MKKFLNSRQRTETLAAWISGQDAFQGDPATKLLLNAYAVAACSYLNP